MKNYFFAYMLVFLIAIGGSVATNYVSQHGYNMPSSSVFTLQIGYDITINNNMELLNVNFSDNVSRVLIYNYSDQLTPLYTIDSNSSVVPLNINITSGEYYMVGELNSSIGHYGGSDVYPITNNNITFNQNVFRSEPYTLTPFTTDYYSRLLNSITWSDNSAPSININTSLISDYQHAYTFNGTTDDLFGSANLSSGITYSAGVYDNAGNIGTGIPVYYGNISGYNYGTPFQSWSASLKFKVNDSSINTAIFTYGRNVDFRFFNLRLLNDKLTIDTCTSNVICSTGSGLTTINNETWYNVTYSEDRTNNRGLLWLNGVLEINITSPSGIGNTFYTDCIEFGGVSTSNAPCAAYLTSADMNPNNLKIDNFLLYLRNKTFDESSINQLNQVNYELPVYSPQSDFTTDKENGNSTLLVNFYDNSKNNPTSWAWDFQNDGIVDSSLQNPNYSYNNSGVYTVNLTTNNYLGSSEIIKTGLITVDNPIIYFLIQANNFNNSINNFCVNIDGNSAGCTMDGNFTTLIISNYGELHNFTVSANYYTSATYLNYNTSQSPLIANLTPLNATQTAQITDPTLIQVGSTKIISLDSYFANAYAFEVEVLPTTTTSNGTGTFIGNVTNTTANAYYNVTLFNRDLYINPINVPDNFSIRIYTHDYNGVERVFQRFDVNSYVTPDLNLGFTFDTSDAKFWLFLIVGIALLGLTISFPGNFIGYISAIFYLYYTIAFMLNGTVALIYIIVLLFLSLLSLFIEVSNKNG